ncbi:hypothetical protein PIROE2DRAFT_7196 [Piromyces sp. E2]|nr:hypothetical protein PIROE2DRAFT_7196 [Piromyces sp. E2]|eukprot:OUM65778.1 hypothetical protein PIROE2DRAFT_7196 [Piromyces sp. E2]
MGLTPVQVQADSQYSMKYSLLCDPYHTKSILPGVPNPSSTPTPVSIVCDQNEINTCMRSNSLATREKCEALLNACVRSKKTTTTRKSILPGVPNPNATKTKSLLPGVPNPSSTPTPVPIVCDQNEINTCMRSNSLATREKCEALLNACVPNPFVTKTVTRTKSILPGVPNPFATPTIISEYAKCSKDDWECKSEMSKRCYEETKDCKRSNSLAVREKCDQLLKICQNIWN